MQELTADWKPAGELLQQLLNDIEAAGKEKKSRTNGGAVAAVADQRDEEIERKKAGGEGAWGSASL